MNQHRVAIAPDYTDDLYVWTQHQAGLLRQIERLEVELPASLDLAHLAEGISDLGKSDLRGTTSCLRDIMVHLIKAASDPQADTAPHWRADAQTFHADLPSLSTQSTRQLIYLQTLWDEARNVAAFQLEPYGRTLAAGILDTCSFALVDFLGKSLDFDEKVARLSEIVRPNA